MQFHIKIIIPCKNKPKTKTRKKDRLINIDDAFPSKYLKASDLPEEGTQAATIEKVQIEEIGRNKDRKPVIHFDDLDKGFVCNKTNANTIAKITGSRNFEDWSGTVIHLYRAEVEFGGEMVESIRVKIKQATNRQSEIREKGLHGGVGEDEIPF